MTASEIFPALLQTTDFVGLDVGASHWLPHHWRLYENEFQFVLVEPDEEACIALENQAAQLPRGAERFRIIQAALSGAAGRRAFYRFNTPTGSSLLKPALTEEDDRFLFDYPNIDNPSYVFPVTEMEVETITLAQVLQGTGQSGFHMIKLDTQGTELEIVKGMGEDLRNTVVVQLEAGDHPLYVDKPGLAETISYMQAQGFCLFDLQLARSEMVLRGSAESLYSRGLFASGAGGDPAFVARLHEVDAVFVRDPVIVLEQGDAEALRRIIVALCVYRMFGEAYQLTGLGEMKGLWDGIAASRYRRDIVRCHGALRQRLDEGYRLYWEKL